LKFKIQEQKSRARSQKCWNKTKRKKYHKSKTKKEKWNSKRFYAKWENSYNLIFIRLR